MRKIFQLVIIFCFLSTNGFAQKLKLEFIGKANFETGYMFKGVELGGLSGITYEKSSNTFYSISDDFSNRAPARFYKLKIDLSDGKLQDGDTKFTDVIYLKNTSGEKYEKNTIDFEGIACINGSFFITSEGQISDGVEPFLAKFSATGDLVEKLNLPKKFLPKKNYGIKDNRGFESLCLTPDKTYLFTANEESLAQDEINKDGGKKTPVRILKFDLKNQGKTKEFLYQVGPLPRSGLVEIISLDENIILTLERSYIPGKGNFVQVYETVLTKADEISAIEKLSEIDITTIQAADKTLLLDLEVLGEKLDNFEGMCFGPVMPNGKLSLIIVSDNNFNDVQATKFFAFSISKNVPQAQTLSITQIQGHGHTSSFLGEKVTVRGIVTAISTSSRNPGFWLQSSLDDGDIGTSQGISVLYKENEISLSVGDSVHVDGVVEEKGRRNELTLTQFQANHIELISSGNALPEPVIIGKNGRLQPTEIIDDDSLKSFDPETDGIDFYESLEGMRVVLQNPIVVGQMSRFNEMVVIPDKGDLASGKSQRGGIVLTANDNNPERLYLIPPKDTPIDPVVGDYFEGEVSGILFYSYGNYKLIAYQALPELVSSNNQREKTALIGDQNHLTVASYNCYNLDGLDTEENFSRIALSMVENLNSPDILALQEVQDNDGKEKSGITDASLTLTRLIENIESAGGPKYDFCQIDPVYNKEGGQPGGNIRVAFLYNPARVELNRRGQATSTDSVLLVTDAKGLKFSPNPGRISPQSSVFERSRVPLATEFNFNGHTIFIINNHFRSKGGDSALFGSEQPPVFKSEAKRNLQAMVVSSFVKSILTQYQDANVVVLGDMNEHEFRIPMLTLKETPLANLGETIPQNERYTYIYKGNSQLLDHIFVSKNLMTSDTKADIVHINAEYPTTGRASDHDPIVARFKLPPDVVKR